MKKIAFLAIALVLSSTALFVEFVRPVMAEGTIYIRADGSVEGTDSIQQNGNVYTFTSDIIEPTNTTYDVIINVQRDNIVIDGAGYALQGTTRHMRGIYLSDRSNVTIKNVEIEGCCSPIYLNNSSKNTIYGNKMANNCYGIYIFIDSINNLICCNNFVNNTRQGSLYGPSVNTWHYNYWSDYNGTDFYSGPYQNESGSDGMGDEPYFIDANETDGYPLMGPFNTFEAGTWNNVTYNVDVVSNSTVSNFTFNADQKLISFNVNGLEGTVGFCRVVIPNVLLGGPYDILVNDSLPLTLNEKSNGTHTFLYFTYKHSTEQVNIIGTTVVPEFSTTGISMLLSLIILTVAIIIYKRRLPQKHQSARDEALMALDSSKQGFSAMHAIDFDC